MKKYKLGFEIWVLLLFLIILLPNHLIVACYWRGRNGTVA